jgi:hypothetical protein
MLSENGPVRTTTDPSFRFELRPIVIPAGFEIQTESIAIWDEDRTTRSFLQFARSQGVKNVRTVEDVIESEKAAEEILGKVEKISAQVVESVSQIFKQVTQGTQGGSS